MSVINKEFLDLQGLQAYDEMIKGVIPNVFSLKNQSLTFTNNVATISDTRITASTYAEIYFSDSSLEAAKTAKVSAVTGTGVITFTVVSEPSTTLVCDIVFTK